MKQHPYIAHLIYRIACAGLYEEQYEEQWRLVFAPDEQQAVAAAYQLGRTEEETFTGSHGRRIGWELIAVKDIQQVSLDHGALLASVIREVAPLTAPLWAA